MLLAHAIGTTRVQLVIDALRPLEAGELSRFRDLVKRRRAREPVAYLLGSREFYGRTFAVDRRVLIPRPDTETLVSVALERTAPCSLSLRAIDLCTGSGCVGITIARERPTSRVYATDLSAGALEVARSNALRLGAYNVAFAEGDLFGSIAPPHAGQTRFDLVVSNPPYIARHELATLMPDVRDFEPRLALHGGEDGLLFVRRILADAQGWLAPGGVVALEVGAGHAQIVSALFAERGFSDIDVARDYGRIDRVVSGVWKGAC